MKKVNLNQLETTLGGDWGDVFGIACATGVFALTVGTSLFTAGATAALGAAGIMGCLAGVAKNTYL